MESAEDDRQEQESLYHLIRFLIRSDELLLINKNMADRPLGRRGQT